MLSTQIVMLSSLPCGLHTPWLGTIAGSIADRAEAHEKTPSVVDDNEESLPDRDPHIGALLNKLGGSISGRNLNVCGKQVMCAQHCVAASIGGDHGVDLKKP